jgi:hypothetical protein
MSSISYLAPPDNAIALSVDEKPSIPALETGLPETAQRPHPTGRNVTTTPFATFEVANGKVQGLTQKSPGTARSS